MSFVHKVIDHGCMVGVVKVGGTQFMLRAVCEGQWDSDGLWQDVCHSSTWL